MTVDMGYVRRITGDTTQKEIADRTGVNQTTISRWLRATNDPSHAGNVAALAIEYGRNPLEAFVAAGLLELDVALRGLDQDSLDLLAEVEGGRPSSVPANRRTRSSGKADGPKSPRSGQAARSRSASRGTK